MRVVFFGTPNPAAQILASLIEEKGVEIVGVVTQPDRPRGRGQKLAFSPVKELALKNGFPLEQPEKVKDNQLFKGILASLQPDICVVVAYGKILPKEVLAIPKHGFINLHASLLPKYRGAAPVQWALIKGEKESGLTIFRLAEQLDAGPILAQAAVPIASEDDAETLMVKVFEIGQQLLLPLLPKIIAGQAKAIPQDDAAATFAPTLTKESGAIDWRKSALEISNMVRGMVSWPVAHTIFRGRRLKLFRVQPVDLPEIDPQAAPGTIVAIVKGEGVVVATGLGHLLIKEIQLAGGKRLSCASFLAGHDVEIGETLPN